MPQQPVELILLRQWASYMSIPVWVMDAGGNLIYYNEPAEVLLGREFDLAGPIQASEMTELFAIRYPDGSPMPNEAVPVVAALTRHQPTHALLEFKGLDAVWRAVEVAAIPVQRPDGELLGVAAIFWEPAKP